MKTKCKTLNLSILIYSVSLILFSIFFFMNKCNGNIWYEYIYNISLGLFGSSFVVFLVSITEYRVAKTQLLEKIWNESIKLNTQLHNIRPIHSYINRIILVNYINEWLFRQTEEDKLIFGDKHEAYDKLHDYLLGYHKESIKKISKKEIESYIDSLINTEREKILEKLEIIIDQYLNLNNYTFLEFNNLLGDVQFFSGKAEYLKLDKNIYEPLRNMYNDLKQNVCYHFELYRNGEANRADVLLSILFKNQNKLFKIEKKKEKDHDVNIIYADFCDNIDDKIEEFRAKTIYGCEEEKINHVPIESTFHIKIKK